MTKKFTFEQKVSGTLYFCIGVFTASQSAFGNDEAYKYVDPHILFWLRTIAGIGAAAAGSLKMYLSGQKFNEPKSGTIVPTKE